MTPPPIAPRLCRVAVTLVRARPSDPSWSCYPAYPVPMSARPTCHRRRLLESWDPLAATTHRYLLLSFPSKPNKYKMFVIWFENLRFTETVLVPRGLVVFMFVWTELKLVIDRLWIEFVSVLPDCGAVFLAFWLCDSIVLCLYLWFSILIYIDKREKNWNTFYNKSFGASSHARQV